MAAALGEGRRDAPARRALTESAAAVFSSPTFLFYFMPVALLATLARRSVAWRNAILLLSSLVLYAWGEPLFVLVMLLSAAGAYLFSRSFRSGVRNDRLLAAAVGLQLSVLAVVKYWDFLAANLQAAGIPLPVLGIPLTGGVSFFTFRAISYLVDVRRGDARAAERFDRVLLYIAVFPQLIAGPMIVRYRTVDGQLGRLAVTDTRRSVGVELFVVGLARKTLIANEVGPVADLVFGLGPMLDPFEA